MRKILGFFLKRSALMRKLFVELNIVIPPMTDDRRYLVQRIFPELATDQSVRNILFAGIAAYTWHYHRYFPGKKFYTIDFDKTKTEYGQPDMHRVGSVTELTSFYQPEFFDTVAMSGLIGYGLNGKDDVEKSIEEAGAVLRPGGNLIIGWNNNRDHLDFDVKDLTSFKKFELWECVEVDASNNHTFAILKKAA